MHKAVFLCLADDLKGLLTGDLPGPASADAVLCPRVELQAHVLFQMTAALAQQPPGGAAGAVCHGEAGALVENGGHFLVGNTAAVAVDGALDGDDPHGGGAHRQFGGEKAAPQPGVLFKARRDLRVLFALSPVVHHLLHDAGDEYRQLKDIHTVF